MLKSFLASFQPQPKPFDSKWIIRALVIIVVILSLTAGYYFTRYIQLTKDMRKWEVYLGLDFDELNVKGTMGTGYTP